MLQSTHGTHHAFPECRVASHASIRSSISLDSEFLLVWLVNIYIYISFVYIYIHIIIYMDIILLYFFPCSLFTIWVPDLPQDFLPKGDGPLDTQVDLHLFCRVSWQFRPGLKHGFFQPYLEDHPRMK